MLVGYIYIYISSSGLKGDYTVEALGLILASEGWLMF